MNNKLEKAAMAIGNQPQIVDKLDDIMTCPNDRAYILCATIDCIHNLKRECTIFTLLDAESRNDEEPCSKYVRSI